VEIKNKVNNELVSNLYEFAYGALKVELSKMFPINSIIKK